MPPPLNPRLLPSVLDRLTDPDSMRRSATGYSEQEMLKAVRADLEDLLNTRQTCDGTRPAVDRWTGETIYDTRTGYPVREPLPEAVNSILTYGLTDLASFGSWSTQQYADLAKAVAATIARFEPRLKNVKVTVLPGTADDPRSVRFHIDAALNVDPAPAVGLVTVLELTTGRATVKTAGEAG